MFLWAIVHVFVVMYRLPVFHLMKDPMALVSTSVSDSSLCVSVGKSQHFSMLLSFSSGHLSMLIIISHCYKITFEWFSGFG